MQVKDGPKRGKMGGFRANWGLGTGVRGGGGDFRVNLGDFG